MTATDPWTPHRAVGYRGHCVHCPGMICRDTPDVVEIGGTLVAHRRCEEAWRARCAADRAAAGGQP